MRATLTKVARDDWRNIRRYLRAKFGRQVEMSIAREFAAAVVALTENPGRGHPIESAVFPDLRGIVVKKSLICYQVIPTHIKIVRILDTRQDTWTELKKR